MEKHILTQTGIIHCQVCSEGMYDEALEWVRKNYPAGTRNNWSKKEKDPKLAPITCESYPTRTHYIFTC